MEKEKIITPTKQCLIVLLILSFVVLPLGFVAAANLSYIPRVYLGGYAGTDSNLLGKGDILAPLYLTANNNFFAYAQGKYAYENQTWQDNTYTSSLGVGYRQIVKDTAVLGAYVFGDYTASTSGHTFWVVSPGIENLTRNWDIRVNGYFPVSKTRWIDEGWANEFGDYHYVGFRVHQQWDHWYQYYQETGIGGDAEVGRNLYMLKGIFKGILFKGFLNSYYYNMKHNDDIYGGGARLTIQPNRSLKLSLRDSYDNYEHNIFMVGVQLSFYDLISDNRNDPIDVQDLQRNLFAPIERNLATIGTGSSIPVTRSNNPEDVGQRLEHDNIWFFKQGTAGSNAVQEDGTYENPFIGLTPEAQAYIETHYQSIGATIDPHPLLYFNSGNYPLGTFSAANEAYRFVLPASWSMYGWVMYDTPINHPATGDERPLFIGGFQMNSNTSINNLRLQNDEVTTSFDTGIILNNATNVVMNNTTVGTNALNTSYITGMKMNNSSLAINNSHIYGYSSFNDDAAGIWATNSGIIAAINNSVIEGTSINGNGYGLYATNNSGAVTIENISNSTFTGTSINVNGYGLYAEADTTGNVTINNISNSTFTGNTNDTIIGVGIGFSARSGTGRVTISNVSNSTFTSTSVYGSGFFAYTFGVTFVSAFTNNTFNTSPVGIDTSGMDLVGANVFVNGNDVTSGAEALAVLGDNTFNVGTGDPILVNVVIECSPSVFL